VRWDRDGACVGPKAANLHIRPGDTKLCPDFIEWLRDTVADGDFSEEQARLCLEAAEDWVTNGTLARRSQ
jgi:hypothetical protein